MANEFPLVIEPEQLNSFLADASPLLLVVDLSNPQNYLQGHVPGAVLVAPQELVAGTPPAPGKLPALAQLNQLFSRLGLTPDTHVVVYDDEGGGWAGRFIWTLDVIGHQRYSYLNGGLWAWRAAGLPTTTESAQPTATSYQAVIHDGPIADKTFILQHINDDDFVVLDARSREEYLGLRHTAQKNGHIPGAIHCEWTELMDRDAQLRIRRDALAYLRDKGIREGQTIVTHCQTHHRSGFTYLVGKVLGLNIKAYPGSWSEWGNDPDTPVQT